jgi:hypothetical protein
MSKCPPVSAELTLPSGCQLVKINLPKWLLDSIKSNDANQAASDHDSDSDEDLSVIDLPPGLFDDHEDHELVMDGLPDAARFTTSVRAPQTLAAERLAEPDASHDPHAEDSLEPDEPLALYMQKNSHLKLVMLASSTRHETHQLENVLRIVSARTFSKKSVCFSF